MQQTKQLTFSGDLCTFNARAKYIPQPDGSLKLALVQSFSTPKFRKEGIEVSRELIDGSVCDLVIDYAREPESARKSSSDGEPDFSEEFDELCEPNLADVERATRRAKINAFDIILCNPCLDTFATFTYKPDDELDKSSYEECYKKLGVWLSNRVQRRGLMYVIVPERHKSGDIHFHGIMNSSALSLERAVSPKGRALSRNGKPIFNLQDWKAGFSTAQIIGGASSDREAVAKYVFKYMGKQTGQKIGGRYCLIGGQNIVRPYYAYGDSVEEFVGDEVAKYDREVKVGEHLEYREYSFI